MNLRLVSFERDGRCSWGVADARGVIDLGARRGGSVLELLRQGLDADTLAAEVAGLDADCALEAVTLLPPVVRGEKIICIGVNYMNRNAEYRDGSDEPQWPSLFMRAYESFTGSEQALWRPPESPQLDYEGEIVLVIGREGHRIPQERALEHVVGLTLMNEGTIRDWVRHAKFNVTQGKNFPRSGAIGPWLVVDEGLQFDQLTLETRVNGELRQADNTANLLFPFAYLVSYLSIFYKLRPGDMISTGTPLGAGARFDPPRYLGPGDVVEVSSPGIGKLRNTVMDTPFAEQDFTAQLRDNRTR